MAVLSDTGIALYHLVGIFASLEVAITFQYKTERCHRWCLKSHHN